MPELPPPARDAAGTKIEMRPYYGPKDLEYVHYLFASSHLDLVPRGVKLRLQSPWFLGAWAAWTAAMFGYIPRQLANWWPAELMVGVYIVLTIGCVGGGIAFLFWIVDRHDVSVQVTEALVNDLRDPGEYYREEGGNFWVLTVQDQPVACIGLDHHRGPVLKRKPESTRLADSPAIQQAQWKTLAQALARIDDAVRWAVLQLKQKLQTAPENPVLFKEHKPNEASVRRLAVKPNLQKNGLSTPLLKRVAFWAHAHQIDYIYAETNELQTRMEEILSKKHGYELVSRTRQGLVGKKSLWRLDVKLWMSKELEAREKQKQEEELKKEEEELKKYM